MVFYVMDTKFYAKFVNTDPSSLVRATSPWRRGCGPCGGRDSDEFAITILIGSILANYWIHRMLHTNWAYKKIHRVHHEYTAPIRLAAPYAHWAEILILGLPSFLGPALVPVHIVTYWLWFISRQLEAIETHSGYLLPWTPTKYIPFYGGAEYHDYHHFVGKHSKSNFASIFTYCDYIYGTNKGCRSHKQVLEKAKSL
ncbi:PREDICTED: methylsterol monooxygenase 1-1-like [Prunus mume]|uniref:Methylsterol monooxygenase 1-1-like n=1 Tax=Prunus mume TaxID=102107 RepID=A0ABM1LQR6_PRUMU|nr:PREDICTED: methylsterol monooxygenase 1-1-like [Prunus mume]